jgi:glycosyltransferase involved in cell wall biosynthesis
MNTPPLLSVGLPVYNGERWIEQALDSILGQSFGDFELIVCDNASTDGTAAICQRVAAKDPRVQLHRNPRNLGAHGNYDRVFELARGSYFKWASCSDVCLPGFFERCVAVLQARPDVVLAYPRAFLIFATPDGREATYEYDDDLHLDHEQPSARFIAYLNRERWNNVMNGVMRSAALRQTALNRPLPGSDISMVAELALRGKFFEVPERLFLRRFTPETTGILMDASGAIDVARGYPGRPTNWQRVQLHSHRFVTAARAPIAFGQKLRVWLHLLRRLWWLRHQAKHKLLRMARLR